MTGVYLTVKSTQKVTSNDKRPQQQTHSGRTQIQTRCQICVIEATHSKLWSMDVRARILRQVDCAARACTRQLATALGVDHDAVVGAAKSLEARGMVTLEKTERFLALVLTAEALVYTAVGSPEVRVFNAVPPEGAIGLAAAVLSARSCFVFDGQMRPCPRPRAAARCEPSAASHAAPRRAAAAT
jgi:hypothetical protein